MNNLRIMTVWDCRVDMLEQKRDNFVENQNCIIVNFFFFFLGGGDNLKRERKKVKDERDAY